MPWTYAELSGLLSLPEPVVSGYAARVQQRLDQLEANGLNFKAGMRPEDDERHVLLASFHSLLTDVDFSNDDLRVLLAITTAFWGTRPGALLRQLDFGREAAATDAVLPPAQAPQQASPA